MPSAHVVSHVCYRATLSCQLRVIWPCFTSFRCVPFRTPVALLHLWWRNFIVRSRLITHKVQLLYRVWPVRGDTLWSYPIVKITAFWDSTPSLSKDCPHVCDSSWWPHLQSLLGTAWHRRQRHYDCSKRRDPLTLRHIPEDSFTF